MHDVMVNSLGGLSLPRKSVVRLTDCPNMTLDVYRGRKTTNQQQSFLEDWYLNNPNALRTAKTLWSFGCSECNRVNLAMRQGFLLLK